MVERWTRERRREHNRSLFLDAAEEVFGEKGFTNATLDGIAHTAGFTKGAIYKYFGTKEDLFLAVCDRHWRSYFENFTEVVSAVTEVGPRELDEVANRWRQIIRDQGSTRAALGHEFTLYLLRNPEARERAAAKRLDAAKALEQFIVEGIDRIGATLQIPPLTFAYLLIATSDSIELASQLDDIDLYRPIIEMYVSAIKIS